ncbi:hypothetical protein, partial [uncultured Eubacterium sp.]|uniref:hypothetical protein n=1 Tax=uncultured Eubacterium sp. TaxID=165185 RepID=UPI0028043B5D
DFEMEALLTQGDSENFKSRFNSAFLAGSDYYLLPTIYHDFILYIIVHLFSSKNMGVEKEKNR